MSGHSSPKRRDVRETVQELRRDLALFSFQNDAPAVESAVQPGSSPELGVRPGGIVEWLVARPGAGAVTSALQIMSQSSGSRGAWAIVDPARQCYFPALAGWGVDLERTLVLRPANLRETCWAIEQCLRCPECRPRGHGSTSGFPSAFIAAGNWRRKWAEVWACFFGRSGRNGSPYGPTCDCWPRRGLEARGKPDGCRSRCCIAGAAWEAAPRPGRSTMPRVIVRLVPEVAHPATAERAARA